MKYFLLEQFIPFKNIKNFISIIKILCINATKKFNLQSMTFRNIFIFYMNIHPEKDSI